MSLTSLTSSTADRAALARLIAMLQTCRPHGSSGEQDFITAFLAPLGTSSDGFGNQWLRIGDAPLLWSSHIDSCHRKAGHQSVSVTGSIVSLAPGSPSNCLGADCAAGMWLMTEMIRCGVEGLYVFHRGEERGGLGSSYVADHEPHRLDGLRAAIAFDRRGHHAIITHQGGERCCSDEFAAALANALAAGHMPDDTGSFTDTANYTDLIGECTNISVGYAHEHSAAETLDLGALLLLHDAVMTADFSRLTFRRQPGEPDPDDTPPRTLGHRGRLTSLERIVRQHPMQTAAFLEDMCGIGPAELQDFIDQDMPF